MQGYVLTVVNHGGMYWETFLSLQSILGLLQASRALGWWIRCDGPTMVIGIGEHTLRWIISPATKSK